MQFLDSLNVGGKERVVVNLADALATRGWESHILTSRSRGPLKPSSESILHYLVLEARPVAGAVVHAHDPIATRDAVVSDGLTETVREEPYGTIALAELAIEAFGRNEKIIVLRNHGYVCAANDMTEAVDCIIATHLRLLDARG
jgi:ribulose-5-phosphate 4-epimerase/fuculose-1-phosphate aldolase